jgi:hypothetical protein
MRLRAFSILVGSMALIQACDCITLPAKQAKQGAEVVFRGTITALHGSGNSRIVVFKVSRVWKGKVKETFEMPALEADYACLGFLPAYLKIGNELIVYAHRFSPADHDYFPVVCNSLPVKDVTDIAALGRGRKPSSN